MHLTHIRPHLNGHLEIEKTSCRSPRLCTQYKQPVRRENSSKLSPKNIIIREIHNKPYGPGILIILCTNEVYIFIAYANARAYILNQCNTIDMRKRVHFSRILDG